MPKRIKQLALWSVIFISISALAQTTAASKTTIVFDDWWNVDYVKNGCARYAKLGKSCSRAPEDTVREFENQVQVAFASERVCHGLELVRFTPEMANDAVKNPAAPAKGAMLTATNAHWTLMLDLDGRSRQQVEQGWSLVDLSKDVLNGTITTPKNLVQQVCNIAKGVGGVAK